VPSPSPHHPRIMQGLVRLDTPNRLARRRRNGNGESRSRLFFAGDVDGAFVFFDEVAAERGQSTPQAGGSSVRTVTSDVRITGDATWISRHLHQTARNEGQWHNRATDPRSHLNRVATVSSPVTVHSALEAHRTSGMDADR